MAPASGTSSSLPAILLLEDDADIRRLLCETFAAAGFVPRPAASVEEAMRSIRRHGPPALAIVDLLLPGAGGLDFCRQVHAFCDLPIVVLTTVTEARTAIAAIERYAEDYVRKPFDPWELVARVRRVLQRVTPAGATYAPERTLDPRVVLDFGRGRARLDSTTVEFTPTEAKLLHVLARNAGSTVPVELLLRRLWPAGGGSKASLRVHVRRLRLKLEPDPALPRFVLTDRGIGYRLAARSHPAGLRSSVRSR